MPKYIDVEAINWYDDLFMKGVNNSGVWVRYKDVESLIRHAPAADVEPKRKTGHWESGDYVEYDGHGECKHFPGQGITCSVCRYSFNKRFLWSREYCPHCGAKMDKEKKDAE